MNSEQFEIITPCHFGLEAVLKREISDLGYEITHVSDGRITFLGDALAVCRANIFLRTAGRVLIKIGGGHAGTFDELFETCKALPWADYLPKDAKFWVTKASTVKSALHSSTDIQSIVKKAVVEKLKRSYHLEWFPETGSEYPIRIFLYKDEAEITLDTSGVQLHKRGYRTQSGAAPIDETLAAGLIMLTPWRRGRILVDPFCGSGTFAIEAAMMASGIAPGAGRHFAAEKWANIIPEGAWNRAFSEAREGIRSAEDTLILGSDIDQDVISIARKNARRAGVLKTVNFKKCDAGNLVLPGEYGFIVTNPPYGERLEEKAALPDIYKKIGTLLKLNPTWSGYVITSYEEAERYIGKKAAKTRKLYNGMIKTYYYQFPGPKPPRKAQ